MSSTSQNVLVIVAICFIVITAATVISIVLVSEKESKPVDGTPITTEDCGNDGGDCDNGIASTIQPITTTQPNNCNPPQLFMMQWIGRYCTSDKIMKKYISFISCT